ncbi:MAG: AEC family transporter, partial [Clostridiales bacterium]|nr:AEC family transporter [Clostridiales bacterium]
VIKALGFDKTAVLTAMALSAVPTAVSSYPTAKAMGADAVLAGQIVAVTSTLSILTVFLWVLSLSAMGWIG